MKQEYYLQDVQEYPQYLWYFILEIVLMLDDPVSQRTVVLLHDDHIGVVDYPVVIHGSDAFIQPEILQAGDLREDVVEDTSLVDALGKVHLFYRHLLGLLDISLAAIDDSICACTDLLPTLVVAQVSEVC